MNQQGMAAAAVKPHWVADMVVGVAGALAAVAVAQAALPIDRPDTVQHTSLRDVRQISTGPVDLPDFVYGEPVAGYEVISPFGLRRLPWEQAGRLHAGVDIAAPAGYPVQAAADGVVTRAGHDGGYGRFVEVRHAEGLTTLYAHLGAIQPGITPGAAVRLGQPIARVGNSGSSTGPHLHFEVHDQKKRPLNPAMFMGRQYATARDLPLKAAARVPRGVRVAYVSYIPRKKRELMEARAAEKAAAEGHQVAALDKARTVAAAKPVIGKINIGQPQVIQLPPLDNEGPISTWSSRDPYGAGGDLPGWPSSGG